MGSDSDSQGIDSDSQGIDEEWQWQSGGLMGSDSAWRFLRIPEPNTIHLCYPKICYLILWLLRHE